MKNIKPVFLLSLILLASLAVGCSKDEESDAIRDIEGNEYATVTINTQVWMAENLKTTTYNDGSAIGNFGDDNIAWFNTTASAYCWYDNGSSYKEIYGALYNGYAVSTGKLCPLGWHVPSRDEWLVLINFLGGIDVAGGKLKEKGTANWESPNIDATDDYGFKALPAGYRYFKGAFKEIRLQAAWWTSTDNVTNPDYASHFFINNNEGSIAYYSHEKTYGHSVRCLKD